MIKQRDGREMALKFLFCQEFASPESIDLSLYEKLTLFQNSFKAQDSVWKFTRQILLGFEVNREAINKKIKTNLVNWSMKRLSITDKSILRIAITEMLFLDTPVKVAINEAVDLSKKYSTKESSAFINGLLDTVLTMEA